MDLAEIKSRMPEHNKQWDRYEYCILTNEWYWKASLFCDQWEISLHCDDIQDKGLCDDNMCDKCMSVNNKLESQ